MTPAKQPLRPIEGVLIVILAVAIVGFGVYVLRLRPIQRELAAAQSLSMETQTPPDPDALDDQRRAIDRQEAELKRALAEKEAAFAKIACKFAGETHAVQSQAVVISDLAERCGLKVHETNFPYHPEATDGAGGFGTMFLARYPEADACRRPLLRLVAEAPYDGAIDFTKALSRLEHRATILRFQFERVQRVPDFRPRTANPATLVLTYLIAL